MAFQLKRKEFYWSEKIYTNLVVRMLPLIRSRPITPNMVTMLNIANTLVVFWLIWEAQWLVVSILVQLYLFLDILDGNLARYKKLSSKTGAVLDRISDNLFYNGTFIVLGIRLDVTVYWLIAYLLVFNLYAAIATWYIVPRIRKMKRFERRGLKKWFMNRGIILGMDLSTQDALTSILILTPFRQWILPIVTMLYTIDLLYRLTELHRNVRASASDNAPSI